MQKPLLLLVFLLYACSPNSIEDLRCEAEGEVLHLAADLHKIETKEELIGSTARLQRRYNRIADLLIEARKFAPLTSAEPTLSSEKLFVELARLYEIPGAREIIEGAQKEAIQRLSKELEKGKMR